jgi:hypothetical protein
MRTSWFSASLPVLLLLTAACDSSTSPHGCNMPTVTESITQIGEPATGIVKRVTVGQPGNTPEGYNPYGQVDIYVEFPQASEPTHIVLDMAIGSKAPILRKRNDGAVQPTSACSIHPSDLVQVWGSPIGSEIVQNPGPGSSVTYVANQVVILSGL